jgi:hypothetical protein
VGLIDRARGVSSEEIWGYPTRTLTNIIFRRYTFFDPTERTAAYTTAVYNSFTITASSDRALWILGISFTREMMVNGGLGESRLQYGDNPIDGYGSTGSTTYVTVRTYTWAGFMVEPGASITIRILFRNTSASTPNTTYMRNVKVEVLYAEVVVQ